MAVALFKRSLAEKDQVLPCSPTTAQAKRSSSSLSTHPSLSSQDAEEVVLGPACFGPLSFDATGCPFLFEQIERHMSQDDKVLLTVVPAHATHIFLKGDIKHPMEGGQSRPPKGSAQRLQRLAHPSADSCDNSDVLWSSAHPSVVARRPLFGMPKLLEIDPGLGSTNDGT